MEKLAYRFFIKKKWTHSAAVYRKVSTLRNDPEVLLEYAARVFECVRAIGSFDNADRDLALIVKALEKQRYASQIPDETKAERESEYDRAIEVSRLYRDRARLPLRPHSHSGEEPFGEHHGRNDRCE